MNPTTMCGQCADSVCAAIMVGAWIIIDIQLCVPTGRRMSERGCPAEQPDFWLFVGTVSQWEVF